jgi:NAD(P)H-nitrite reductase large subunit
MTHFVIIGNGITGTTCARHIRKRDSQAKITIISSESRYFYSRTALMYIYMGHMKYEHTKPYENWFWEKNRLDLVFDHVEHIDTAQKSLSMRSGDAIRYDKLVIATGSKPNKFGWPGQDLKGVQGMYSLQDLSGLEEQTDRIETAVLVGGGLIGIELAEMLLTRHKKVIFLVREDRYWGNVLRKEEAELVQREIAHHGVDLRLNSELDSILDDGNGYVRAIRTKAGEEIPCEFVGLTAGVSPNIDLVKEAGIGCGRGVKVNYFLETDAADVYAAGDCAELVADGEERGRPEQLWYTGRMQAEALAKTLTGDRTRYERGIWFNSAKFMDIEYHTYGFVFAEEREGEDSFYWEDETGQRCFRLVWRKDNQVVVGMNAFGIRYRHQVFDRWIGEKRDTAYVLNNLREANFDPEFFDDFEPAITAYASRHFPGKAIAVKPRRKFLGLL